MKFRYTKSVDIDCYESEDFIHCYITGRDYRFKSFLSLRFSSALEYLYDTQVSYSVSMLKIITSLVLK